MNTTPTLRKLSPARRLRPAPNAMTLELTLFTLLFIVLLFATAQALARRIGFDPAGWPLS